MRRRLSFFLLCFLGCVILCSAAQISFERINGRSQIRLSRLARNYGFSLQSSGKNLLVRGKYHRFRFTPEKKQAEFNSIAIMLNYPLDVKGGVYYLSAVDWETVIRPLLSRSSLSPRKIRRIVLDPGHGGKDNGAKGRHYRESILNLRLACKLKLKLEKMGFIVILTRSRDSELDLSARPYLANTRGADLFLSLHMNASLNRATSGIETFCLTPAGAVSSNGGKVDRKAYLGNCCNPDNFVLAYLIQRSLISATGATDLGIKHARFAVLRDVKCPAVLIEHGFISNPAEEWKLGSDAYLDRLAAAVAHGVSNYAKAVAQ